MTDTSSPTSEIDSPVPATNGVAPSIETNGDINDSDEDIQARSARKHAAPDEEDVPDLAADDDAGGLFGSGSEDEGSRSPKRRKLSDEGLDSGDDEGRRDIAGDEDVDMDAERGEERELVVARIDLARHGMPQGSDGELFLFRNPTFMSIEPKAFSAESFRPPTTGHHGESPTTAFSAATTADSTIRWRRDPDDPIKLQSNARLIRWSDGSLTLQHGASPAVQHELPAKSLAPPRMKSSKPLLPVRTGRSSAYDSRLESHTYLASLHNSVGFVQITNHLTASLTVHTSKDDEDDAVIRLQEAMSAAVKTNKGGDGDGPGIISIKEDPELAKRKAEIAEKEKMRAEKRRQNQVERERDRANRVVGPRARANGLTVGGLEDEDGMLSSRAKPKPARRARRRNSEYSSDEEDGYRRKTKEDEYDQDDGFLVGSDEEPEIVEDASEEEEFGEADAEGDEDEEEEEVAQKPAKTEKAKTPADDDDAGAGGRGRRRRVVDEDED